MKPLTLSPVRQQINLRAQKEFWLVGFAVFSVNRPFRWFDLIFRANTFQLRPWTLSAFTRTWKNDYSSMKIYYEQCCVNIGVVVATKWRHYLFYFQPYLEFSFYTITYEYLRELDHTITASMFVMFEQHLWEHFGDALLKFLCL